MVSGPSGLGLDALRVLQVTSIVIGDAQGQRWRGARGSSSAKTSEMSLHLAEKLWHARRKPGHHAAGSHNPYFEPQPAALITMVSTSARSKRQSAAGPAPGLALPARRGSSAPRNTLARAG